MASASRNRTRSPQTSASAPPAPHTRPCEQPACGAQVLVLEVDGAPLAVDPVPLEVVLAETGGHYRLTQAYRPHRATCVDISGRVRGRQP